MAHGMNPQKMLKQMQKMQEDMARVQAELQQESVTASAGGGAVTARVSGGLELLEITIDPAAVDPEDVELLQDVIVAAVNEAMRSAQQLAQDRLGTVAGGLSGLGHPRPLGRGRRRRVLTPSIERLVAELARLPGIGPRSAQRLAFHMMKAPPERARGLAEAIVDMTERLRPCSVCFSFAEAELCPICADPRRDPTLLCAVEEPSAILPIERTNEYRGRYHVLGGRAVADRRRRPRGPAHRRAGGAHRRPTASPSWSSPPTRRCRARRRPSTWPTSCAAGSA